MAERLNPRGAVRWQHNGGWKVGVVMSIRWHAGGWRYTIQCPEGLWEATEDELQRHPMRSEWENQPAKEGQ